MQERVPAQNIEAEQAVLGAILIDNSVMNKVTEILKSPDFYRIVHQIIYQIMLDLYARHEPVDMVTLTEELKNQNKLDDAGGVSYITLLANIVPTSANALYHARIVVNNALLRQLRESGPQTGGLLQSGNEQRPAGAADALYRSRHRSESPGCRVRHRIPLRLPTAGQ